MTRELSRVAPGAVTDVHIRALRQVSGLREARPAIRSRPSSSARFNTASSARNAQSSFSIFGAFEAHLLAVEAAGRRSQQFAEVRFCRSRTCANYCEHPSKHPFSCSG
jgi:hypothetical protein